MMLKRKKIAGAIILPLFVLSGCAGNAPGAGLDARIQKTFEELPSLTAEVKILSDLGESTLEYSGQYEYNKDDNDIFTLKTPETLENIVITASGEQAEDMTVQYADTVLDSGMPARAGATPADVIPLMLSALRTAAPQETWEETIGGVKMIAARYETADDQGKLMRQVWLTRDSLRPAYAECYADGTRILQVFFSGYQ